MQFVLPYVRPIQHLQKTSNISLPESNPTTEADEHDAEPPEVINVLEDNNNDDGMSKHLEAKKRKRKHPQEKDEIELAILQYIKEKKNKPSDDDRKMFLLSLLNDVKSLSEKNMRQFKIKTLLLIEQLLTQQEQSGENFQMHDCSPITHAPSPTSLASSVSTIFDTTDGFTIHNLDNLPPSTSNITFNNIQ